MDPGSPTPSGELGSEFWKDLPDDVLEDIYKNLDSANDLVEGELLLDDLGSSGAWRQKSTGAMGGQLADQLFNLKTESGISLTQSGSAFSTVPQQTPSQSGSTGAQPAQSQSIQPLALPTFNQIPATAQQVRARGVIEQAWQVLSQHDQILQQMKQAFPQPGTTPSEERVKELQEQIQKLTTQIETSLKELKQLNRMQVLEAEDLHDSKVCIQRFSVQQIENDLIKQELQQILHPQPNAAVPAALLISEQPVPQVVFKGKAMDDCFSVQLFLAPGVEIHSLSKVKAKLISDEPSWKADNPIENDEATLDAYHRVGKFGHFKIHVSTRMSMVRLKFSVTVTSITGATSVIQSEASHPFIVITNESQWCEAAFKLLQDNVFGGQSEAPWPQFANTLHHHFLKATRQDPGRPVRALSPLDFHYIYTKFFNSSPIVTVQQATPFWQWFGPVSQALRFKRHINCLWFYGLIHGIITKEECNMALMNQDLGTFMIRFSETCPGLFAVAYVSDDPCERVKHYLVKPEDTGSQKTLPDFLGEKPQFQYLYQYDHHTGMLRRYSKEALLKNYYSKKKLSTPKDNGYVLL